MLNVVAPGKLVLTLQSIPPFVVESIFALTLTVLLAVPLILHIHRYLDDPLKSTRSIAKVRGSGHDSDRAVVMHYPASKLMDSASSSSAELQMRSVRQTISTPILQGSGDNVRHRRDPKIPPDTLDNQTKVDSAAKENDVPLKRSSSFIATNSELPPVDISAFNYDAYRYKLIEAALRKQYNNYQPPGDVVLNSIHLNNNDSTVNVKLNDRYHHSFFDFIEEYYDVTKGMNKKEMKYMHPLDHFLVKDTQKPETTEKETETRRVQVVSNSAGQDEKSPRISFYDDGVNSRNLMEKRQGNKDLDTIEKKNSRLSKPRSSSVGAESTFSKRSILPHCSRKRNVTKLFRTTSSTDSISSKRDTLSASQKRDDKRDSSIDGGERESMNCTTASSIDSESVRSESSKPRDDHSCHSRDSSVTSKRYTSDKPQIQPWLSGNPRVSFNRKYGNTGKLPSKTSEVSGRSSSLNRCGILSTQQHSKQFVNLNSNEKLSTNRSLSGRKTSRSSSCEGRDGLRLSCKNDGYGKLETIRSETEENVKSDLSCTVNSLSSRNLRNVSKFKPEIVSSVPVSDAVLRNEAAKETRIGNKKKNSEYSIKLPAKHGQSEKFAKVYRDRRQRSRASSPVLAKVAVQSPKIGLPMEMLASKSELRETMDSNAKKSIEKRRESRSENARPFRKDDRRPQEKPRSKEDADAKSNSCGRRKSFGSARSKEEGKGNVTKLIENSSRKRAAGEVGKLGASAKNSFTVNNKSSSSKILQQKIGVSKIGASSPDTATSKQISSCRSFSNEKKDLMSTKTETIDTNKLEMKESIPEGLKLPRRDSKAGMAMKAGLKKYIKNVKRVLSNRDNSNIGELASLSLTDAILPDLESTLSSVEVQQVENLLNMAESAL